MDVKDNVLWKWGLILYTFVALLLTWLEMILFFCLTLELFPAAYQN